MKTIRILLLISGLVILALALGFIFRIPIVLRLAVGGWTLLLLICRLHPGRRQRCRGLDRLDRGIRRTARRFAQRLCDWSHHLRLLFSTLLPGTRLHGDLWYIRRSGSHQQPHFLFLEFEHPTS